MSSIRKIVQGNDNYFLQIKIVSEVSVINLTDLKNLWQTRITESEAVQKFKVDY